MAESDDADVVARTLYGEARGEGRQGMVAVACVIVTRAMIAADYMDAHDEPHPLYGDGELASVCKAFEQFSCWNQGDPNRSLIEKVTPSDPIFLAATEIARQAEDDGLDDITDNATHYYDRRMPRPPAWAVGKTPCATIGHHLFFNNIS